MWTSRLRPAPNASSGTVLGELELGAGPVSGADLHLHGVAKSAGSRRLVFQLLVDGHAPISVGELHTYGEGSVGTVDEHPRFAPMDLCLAATDAVQAARPLGTRCRLRAVDVGGAPEPFTVGEVELRVW